MPNRVIKESIWTSPTLAKVSYGAASHFLWLLPLPDDHGCCQLTPNFVKGRLYFSRKEITEANIKGWNDELEAADLIRTWEHDGRIFAYFPKWAKHQRIRSTHERKTPEPPSSVVNRGQLSANDGLNPNLNPNLNLNLNLNLNPVKDLPSQKPTTASRKKLIDQKGVHQQSLGLFSAAYKRSTGQTYAPSFGRDLKLLKGIVDALKSGGGMADDEVAKHIAAVIEAFFDPAHNFKGNMDVPQFCKAFNRLQGGGNGKQIDAKLASNLQAIKRWGDNRAARRPELSDGHGDDRNALPGPRPERDTP